jgi:hypothetical protein
MACRAQSVGHLEQMRAWFGKPLWDMEPADTDTYFGKVVRHSAKATRLARAQALTTYLAMVPIDDELTGMIAAQQTRVRERVPGQRGAVSPRQRQPGWPPAHPHRDVQPAPEAVVGHRRGHRRTRSPGEGECPPISPLLCRLINNEVPQEVVRRLLDHTSHAMTSRYARLADTTIRKQWERAQKINIRGEPVQIPVDGPLAEGAWMKENLARAKMALPHGYCGLPLQKSCPHANACLTCPLFVTTAEFLPQHHQQLDATRALIAQAQAAGQTRMVEMNHTVETNLLAVINTLDNGCDCDTASGESCCGDRRTPDAG